MDDMSPLPLETVATAGTLLPSPDTSLNKAVCVRGKPLRDQVFSAVLRTLNCTWTPKEEVFHPWETVTHVTLSY